MANLFESTAEAIWIRYFENNNKFEKKRHSSSMTIYPKVQ